MSAGLKTIRKRIGSVKNTQKITRAMKMVAAAKLRRASERIAEMRPFAERTAQIVGSLAAHAAADEHLSGAHPLLRRRDVRRVVVFAMSSDRGLAGGHNASVQKAVKAVWDRLEAEGKEVSFAVAGRKIREHLRRRGARIAYDFGGQFEEDTATEPGRVSTQLVQDFCEGAFDECVLVYTMFRSPIRQDVIEQVLLPVSPAEMSEGEIRKEMVIEPDAVTLLQRLVPMHVQAQIYRAVLDSSASEHGARMSAMDAATSNASQIIDDLNLQFNRARQAAITKELMEIIGGAEALQ